MQERQTFLLDWKLSYHAELDMGPRGTFARWRPMVPIAP